MGKRETGDGTAEGTNQLTELLARDKVNWILLRILLLFIGVRDYKTLLISLK